MTAKKNSFLLYTDNYTSAIKKLSYEQKGQLFDAIFHKGGSIADKPDLDGLLEMAFSPIEAAMDRAAKKYEDTCRKRSESGKKGGRPPGSGQKAKKANGFSESKRKQKKAKKADSDSDSDSDSDLLPLQGGKNLLGGDWIMKPELGEWLNTETGETIPVTPFDEVG